MSNNMTLDPELVELAAGGKKEEAKKDEPKVMCFVSRREVPLSETVELKYKNQVVRVSKPMIKYAE